MSRRGTALLSAFLTSVIIAIGEEVLFWNVSKDDFENAVFVRMNLLALLFFSFISNWVFVNTLGRTLDRKEKSIGWNYSLLYTLLFSIFIFLFYMMNEAHFQSGKPWPRHR